jgi:hypothetical protein
MMIFRLNIVHRGGVFYWRKAVPLALRSLIGQREWLVSLRTSDPMMAF